MGSTLPCGSEKSLKIEVSGEEKFKAVEILKNGELYKRFRPMTKDFSTELTIDASEQSYWYIRAVQIDNEMAWSSPIWFEA